MELDDELRRMFANVDDQLDVPVRPDAEQTIVAGAQRVRRRRLAAVSASGAAAVVVVVAAGIALANPTPDAMPPAHTPTSTSSTPTSPSSAASQTTESGTGVAVPPAAPPATETDPPEQTTEDLPTEPEVTGEQIGPFGFRDLRLGMDYETAVATGMVGAGDPPPPGPGCAGYPLLIDGVSVGDVGLSGERGVVAIAPDLPVHNVDGVSVGWTTEQFLAKYPDKAEEVEMYGIVTVPVTGNPDAFYRFDVYKDRGVTTITLQMSGDICPA